jgi:hypothetical protein
MVNNTCKIITTINPVWYVLLGDIPSSIRYEVAMGMGQMCTCMGMCNMDVLVRSPTINFTSSNSSSINITHFHHKDLTQYQVQYLREWTKLAVEDHHQQVISSSHIIIHLTLRNHNLPFLLV